MSYKKIRSTQTIMVLVVFMAFLTTGGVYLAKGPLSARREDYLWMAEQHHKNMVQEQALLEDFQLGIESGRLDANLRSNDRYKIVHMQRLKYYKDLFDKYSYFASHPWFEPGPNAEEPGADLATGSWMFK